MIYDRNFIANMRPQALTSGRRTSIMYVEYTALGAPTDVSTWNHIFTTEFLSQATRC